MSSQQVNLIIQKVKFLIGMIDYTETQKETYAGNIDVLLVPLRPRFQSNAVNISLNHISFVWSGFRFFHHCFVNISLMSYWSFDYHQSQQEFQQLSLSGIKKHIQQSGHKTYGLKATGYVKNNKLLWLVEWMVHAIYSCADTLHIKFTI